MGNLLCEFDQPFRYNFSVILSVEVKLFLSVVPDMGDYKNGC